MNRKDIEKYGRMIVTLTDKNGLSGFLYAFDGQHITKYYIVFTCGLFMQQVFDITGSYDRAGAVKSWRDNNVVVKVHNQTEYDEFMKGLHNEYIKAKS